jgi:hypothetical protein
MMSWHFLGVTQENHVSELHVASIFMVKVSRVTVHVYTGSSKKNAGIIKTYHSKTVRHIEMIQLLKCGESA